MSSRHLLRQNRHKLGISWLGQINWFFRQFRRILGTSWLVSKGYSGVPGILL